MDFSYRIARIAGIDLEIHLFFLMFIGLFVFYNIYWALFLILVFGYVTMHEFAHSIVAMRNKIRVRRIILLPIGGMSVMDTSRIKPLTEIKMTLAGPLSNLVVACLCLASAYALGLPWGDWLNLFMMGENLPGNPVELFLFFSFYANAMLGAFNLLLPAFPLDGGRILRAVLALKMDYVQATGIAKNMGLGFALVMFSYGVFTMNLWFAFIAVFIAFGAIGEYEGTLVNAALSKLHVQQVLSKDFLMVPAGTRLDALAAEMDKKVKANALVKSKAGFRVFDVSQLKQIPADALSKYAVENAARPAKPVTCKTKLDKVLHLMSEQNVTMLPVVKKRGLAGVISKTDLEKAVHVKLHAGAAAQKK